MTFYQGNSKEAARALQLQKRRLQQQEDIELKKKKLEEENKMTSIDNKFMKNYDAVEHLLKTDTIGLVTLEDMKKKRELITQQREKQLARERKAQLEEEIARREKKQTQKSQIQKLSFAEDLDEEEENDDDEEEKKTEKTKDEESGEKDDIDQQVTNEKQDETSEEVAAAAAETTDKDKEDVHEEGQADKEEKTAENEDSRALVASHKLFKKRFGKNPNVDTSFLPDKEREIEEDLFREKLRKEWVEAQEKLKNEDMEIVFSYWDGSGHRRSCVLKKGNTIQQFLYKVLEQLRKENQFNELRIITVDQLMYVKEDIILPHHYTFYDLIVTKARGKSGPLFLFDCRDDVRLTNDASVEKEESHAGKILIRSWYERHKHIFPYSRWEPYDPEKKWLKPYTIGDRKS